MSPTSTATRKHPRATPKQRALIARLTDELGYEELLDAAERAAITCGYTERLTDWEGRELLFADMNAWGAPGERGYTKREASALITEMRAIVAEGPFASWYCGQRGEKRGKPCRTVHYFDGHFDYECGLS